MYYQIKYSDGSTKNVVTAPAPSATSATSNQASATRATSVASMTSVWTGNSQNNPIRYTHLAHGEIYDARREVSVSVSGSGSGSGGDSCGVSATGGAFGVWEGAKAYVNSTSYEGPNRAELSLHTMPPMGRIGTARRGIRCYIDM